MWNDFTHAFLVIFTSLLPVVNPPGSALMVLGILPDATPAQRTHVARAVALNSLVMLATSIGVGAYVLSFFGISIPVLRLAGGLVIAATGWRLLQAPAQPDRSSLAGAAEEEARDDTDATLASQIFYPFTLPITVGPGSIAVAIAVGTSSPAEGPALVHVAAASAALLVLCALIYLCMRYACRLQSLLGRTGMQVVLRLLAFVILCIGVQIGWLGLSELLGLPQTH
ncbi:MarC family protein [Stenotrophomonas sp. LGBM10]|uniref:MarC family protein n=1 Tax=Stenotrophomonas sp. LGBM10 TaxID=3390038 RepID=UPI00398A6479